MISNSIKDKTICVVGLGYVGYPLAKAFSGHVKTIGFDIDTKKISYINGALDNQIIATTDPSKIGEADFILIAVPTPVTKAKDPDLSYVKSAAEIVGKNIKKGAVIVLESTVYPGTTEEVLKPILENESGYTCGVDFSLGYSPERVNPGDNINTLDKITKIISGADEVTTKKLAELYDIVTNIYVAKDIRTAEAAKLIENIQRDLNIALMNELSIIFSRMGINTKAVLEAAGTKWNFHHYRPGLVGGHCIPVDPYYLVMKAEEFGYHPQVLLAGRAINDSMPLHVAQMAIKGLNENRKVINGSKVLILGLTYKENVPDIRESPVVEMVKELKEFHIDVYGYDPLLSQKDIYGFNAKPIEKLDGNIIKADCIIINSPHNAFTSITLEDIIALSNGTPIIVDVTGMLSGNNAIIDSCKYITL
ncbi:MAG: nucleotide sugar dehydrogenase [Methanomicrobiaceae archaeon]|nr:nucleotide sugar dehydrogenase [Methanomicrobiaceae archaeon]